MRIDIAIAHAGPVTARAARAGTLALVAVIALLGGLALGTLAIVVLGRGRRRT